MIMDKHLATVPKLYECCDKGHQLVIPPGPFDIDDIVSVLRKRKESPGDNGDIVYIFIHCPHR